MSARIFIHPRCVPDAPPQGAMIAALHAANWDITNIAAAPATPKGYRELVRRLETHPDGSVTFARMDGTTFVEPGVVPPQTPAPQPTHAA